MIKELRAALRIVAEQEKRRKEYEALVGDELNYKILKDLVNQASHGVVIEVDLKDGRKLIIRREEAFDQLSQVRRESW